MIGILSTVNHYLAALSWALATSPPFLLMLALIAIAAFCVAHVPLIGRLIPSVAPFQRLALLIQVVGFAALMFLLGFRAADNRAETESLRNDLAWTQFQLTERSVSAQVADELRTAAERRAAEAKEKVDAYHRNDAAPGAACAFTADDLARLRDIRQRGSPGGAKRR